MNITVNQVCSTLENAGFTITEKRPAHIAVTHPAFSGFDIFPNSYLAISAARGTLAQRGAPEDIARLEAAIDQLLAEIGGEG